MLVRILGYNIILEHFSQEGSNGQLIGVDHLDEILVLTIDTKSIIKGKRSKPFYMLAQH